MKKAIFTLAALSFLSFNILAHATSTVSLKQNFPHWNTKNHKTQLTQLQNFINQNANQNKVAIFDWDGTLYDEKIPVKGPIEHGEEFSGMAIWHVWGAQHNMFPMYQTADESGSVNWNVIRKNDYTEGHTSVQADDYSKFVQIAAYEAGMTRRQFYNGIQQYLKTYPVSEYAYFPMLDIVQDFINHGYQVYIETGSNPYYILAVEANLDKTEGYHLIPASCNPRNANLDVCHVVGNSAKLMKNGKFSMVYDARFTANPQHVINNPLSRHIVDGPGKAIAIHNYIQHHDNNKPIVFYAGNSGGDYAALEYVLNQPNSMGIAVNPRGAILDQVAEFGSQSNTHPKLLVANMTPK